MNKFKQKSGFTLVEMIVVIAIITILAGVLLKVGGRVAQQSKEAQTRASIDILDSALEQFAQSGFDYKGDYSWLKFPPDCNGLSKNDARDEIADALDKNVQITGGTYDGKYSGCGVMYFFLNRQPESREVLKNIDKSMITNKNSNNERIYIEVTSNNEDRQPFYWVVDAWGKPLRYDYYDENENLERQSGANNDAYDTRRSFPLITSAGPDGQFDTEDDITNQK